MIKKNLANFITVTRMIATLVLLPLKVLSGSFFAVYAWCGISDVLDGLTARTLKITSELGSKLDSASDLAFYTVMMIKIYPYLMKLLPMYVWVLIYSVVIIRAVCYIFVRKRDNCFIHRHTLFNKLTGLTMFFLPYLLEYRYFVYYCLFVLMLAYMATVDEISWIRKNGNSHD